MANDQLIAAVEKRLFTFLGVCLTFFQAGDRLNGAGPALTGRYRRNLTERLRAC
jgi:hypothetical protein